METKITVRSDLIKIAEDLKVIAKTAQDTADSINRATKDVADGINDQNAKVTDGMDKMRKYAKSVAKSIADDFKTLLSVNALLGGLKLNEQLGGTIKQAVTLNDTIRNLAPVFGMTEDRAERFKRTLVKGLAEIGVGSDAAANALQGLSETNVRGDRNLEEYAKTASELAGITNQKGQEGNISKGLAGVVTAQGGNVNDPFQMRKVADDVVKIRNATGKTATEALGTLNDLYTSTNSSLKQKLAGGGGTTLAMAGLIGGEHSTDFLKRYLKMDEASRQAPESQGLGKLIGKNGELNLSAFQSTISEAKRRGLNGNVEQGLGTMGMSDDEAKGFMRLSDALKINGEALEKARTSTVNLNTEYRSTMSLGDAFRANLNKVKGGFTEVMDVMHAPDIINKGTNMLSGASQSTAGSAAVVGGGALLAAMLTSKGLAGLFTGALKDEAKTKAIEGITGEHVQKVEVINFPSGFGGGGAVGGAASLAGGAISKLGPLAMLAGPVGAALAGTALAAKFGSDYAGDKMGQKPVDEANKFAKEQEEFRAAKISAKNEQSFRHDVRVTVDTKDKSLKAYQKGSLGPAQ